MIGLGLVTSSAHKIGIGAALSGFGLVLAGRCAAAPTLHDPDNAESQLLQRIEAAIPASRRDKTGQPDWVGLLKSGQITPRASLDGQANMPTLDLDILMRNTKLMPWVKFPHRPHTEWLDCINCHDQIFVAKAGSNNIDMTRIFRGEYCGVCHGKVAFQPFVACERCHSVPQGDIPAWWVTP